MSSTLTDAWIKTALQVTGHFEDSSDPLGAVSGDFDGMGISLGVLQWNIGSSSLQPLVRALGRAKVVTAMPNYGVDLWTACTSTLPTGLSIVRGWQNGTKLRAPVMTELKAFTHSQAFVAQQIAASRKVAEDAFKAAAKWAAADPAAPGRSPSKGQFCWFFDTFTQNGGLKGLSYASAEQFIHLHGATGADDTICNWLAARTSADAGFRDSRKNAELWRDKVQQDDMPLVAMSYLRALSSRVAYRGDVLNRKATIAIGRGWVHAELHDLRAVLQS